MRTTKAQSDALARAIQDAAARRFAREGYAAVALEDVASDAGATRGAVYHHFGSKEGLFRAVLQLSHQRVGDAVAAAADAVEDLWEGFLVGCEAFVRSSLDDDFRRVLLVDGPAVVGMAAWQTGDAAGSGRHLVEAVEALSAEGLIDARLGPALVAMLSGALNEAALWAAESSDPDSAVADTMVILRSWLASMRRP